MSRKGLVGASLIVLLGAIGCSGNKANQGDMEIKPQTVEPAPQEVTAPPTPPVSEDPNAWLMSDDLRELNEGAFSRGLLGDVFFDFDRFDLKPEARERLAKNARFLIDNPQLVLTIEGHCDERGTNEYNLALGQRRASTAMDYLVSLGVAESRFRTISYGEERQFCTQADEACWAQNRRAHFVITSKTSVG